MSDPRPHLVHFRPSFGTGGAELRTVQLLNHLGSRYRQTMVAFDGVFTSADKVSPAAPVRYISCRNSRNPAGMLAAVRRLLRDLSPQLVLTYNWGSMDAVAAVRLSRCCPLIHTEDGFDVDEAERQLPRRVLFRRLLLAGAHRVVVPSETLLRVVLDVWKLPKDKVLLLPNGVDLERFSPVEKPASDELVIGCVGNLKPVKRQQRLLDACAHAAKRFRLRLLLAGDGSDRPMLEQRAADLGIADRVEFLGLLADTSSVYRRLDIFALSSETEQMPLTVLEAMAAGLPVVSTDVGDVKSMVSDLNRSFIVPPAEYPAALERMASDADLRRAIGEANRRRAGERFDLRWMLARYEMLYEEALRRGA